MSQSVTIQTDPPQRRNIKSEWLKAIAFYMQGHSKEEVAAYVGVHRRTIYRWFRNPNFVSEIVRSQREMLATVNRSVRPMLSKAVGILKEELEDECLKPMVNNFGQPVLDSEGIDAEEGET